MKKLFALAAVAMLAMALAGCGTTVDWNGPDVGTGTVDVGVDGDAIGGIFDGIAGALGGLFA